MIRLRSIRVPTAFTILFLSLTTGTAGLFLLSLSSSRPSNLGVRDGRLAACPNTPNCVSTQAEDYEHWISPLTYQSEPSMVIETLAQIVGQLRHTRVIEKSTHYLHAEFRSGFFRFVDDVEFYVEAESGRVHFRSASRVGHSDSGTNRARMELIRSRFQAMQPTGTIPADLPGTQSRLQRVR